MKHLHLDQVGGVSGDMWLGVLVGLGVDPTAIEAAIRSLGLDDVRLEVRDVEKAGLRAKQVTVVDGAATHGRGHSHEPPHAHEPPHEHSHEHAHEPPHEPPHEHSHEHAHEPPHEHAHEHAHEPGHEHFHRSYSDIVTMIRGAGLPGRVVEDAVSVFTRLGKAESEAHGVPLEEVHFHEVGAVDSIADVVGTCWGLYALGVERITSTPFLFGHGEIRMAHGTWPVPAPATVRLTEGLPARFVDLEGETVTPTGAALVATLASGFSGAPLMRIVASAAGAGTRDWPDRPNVLRAFLGETGSDLPEDEVEVLETAVDDMTPEVVAHLAATLFDAGALDVTSTPTVMKKGRPGVLVTVLVRPEEAAALRDLIFRHSTTLGIRRRRESRWTLARSRHAVDTPWGSIGVKIADLPGGGRRYSPEYEECARIARETGVPLLQVMESARVAAEAELSGE